MANRHRGEVDVQLNGETRTLRFTLNALAELEDRLSLPSIQAVGEALRQPSNRTFRAFLWAGLQHAQPELTEREVGELDFEFTDVYEAMSRAFALAYASPAQLAAGPPGAPGAPPKTAPPPSPASGTGPTP